jgi:ATP-dependent RNA helicase DHX37/DHR1
MMSPAQQARVFREMPPGTRLIVVATNVAETSITIPGIRYVVDCGRQKVKTLQSSTGIWYVDIYVFCNWLSRFL